MSSQNPEIDRFGNKFYYQNGCYHREDGPAIEYVDGDKIWYKNGLRHRDDGAAVENSLGDDKFWWVHGKLLNYSIIEFWNSENSPFHILNTFICHRSIIYKQ